MLDDRIDVIDHQTETPVTIPPDTLAVVERADRILEELLQGLRHIPLRASWCRFVFSREEGWLVTLDLYTPNQGYGQQVRVDDLRDAHAAKAFIWEVISQLGRILDEKTDVMIRQLRADLRKMLQPVGV